MRKMLFPALVTFLASPVAFGQDPIDHEGLDHTTPMEETDVDVKEPIEVEPDVDVDETEIEVEDDMDVETVEPTEDVRGEEYGSVTVEVSPDLSHEIPRNMLPPAGTCRVWDPNLEAGMEQMRAMHCADAWLLVQPGQWVVEHPTDKLTIVHVPDPDSLDNRERFRLNE